MKFRAAGTDSVIEGEVQREVAGVAGAELVNERDAESGGQTVEPRHSTRIAAGTSGKNQQPKPQ